MAEQERKIIVDEDWKREAQREKEVLAAQERDQQKAHERRPRQLPQADLVGLVNMLATQAFFAMGLLRIKDQPQSPPDLEAARYNIDMLAVLEQKTKGNLEPDEAQMLADTLHNLRLAYVEVGKQLTV